MTTPTSTDVRSPILEDFDANSSALLVAFTGKGRYSGLNFNFRRMTAGLKTKRLYVRDTANLWYHGEHRGIGRGVGALSNHLREVISAQDVSRVVTLGSSMDGYAAILFGALINADAVVAITPQTFLDRRSRIRYADTRSIPLKNRIYSCPSASPRYFNLGRFLRTNPYDGQIHLHYGWDRLDVHHARQIASLPNVEVTIHETHRHDLSRLLKRKGILPALIKNAVGIDVKQPTPFATSSIYARLRSRVKGLLAT